MNSYNSINNKNIRTEPFQYVYYHENVKMYPSIENKAVNSVRMIGRQEHTYGNRLVRLVSKIVEIFKVVYTQLFILSRHEARTNDLKQKKIAPQKPLKPKPIVQKIPPKVGSVVKTASINVDKIPSKESGVVKTPSVIIEKSTDKTEVKPKEKMSPPLPPRPVKKPIVETKEEDKVIEGKDSLMKDQVPPPPCLPPVLEKKVHVEMSKEGSTKVEGRDALLEQIRANSFNLKKAAFVPSVKSEAPVENSLMDQIKKSFSFRQDDVSDNKDVEWDDSVPLKVQVPPAPVTPLPLEKKANEEIKKEGLIKDEGRDALLGQIRANSFNLKKVDVDASIKPEAPVENSLADQIRKSLSFRREAIEEVSDNEE